MSHVFHEAQYNLWQLHAAGFWCCITTNGALNAKKECVMGRGTAYQAKKKYPQLPRLLGTLIRAYGNTPQPIDVYRLISFPVKHHWAEQADLKLIEQSCVGLVNVANNYLTNVFDLQPQIVLPRPSCSNGRRNWETEVKPILLRYLDGRFLVVHQ